MTIFTRAFWLATLERAIGTAAATFLATIGTAALVSDVSWPVVGSTVALATMVTVAKALVAGTRGKGPGFGNAEALADGKRKPTHRAGD